VKRPSKANLRVRPQGSASEDRVGELSSYRGPRGGIEISTRSGLALHRVPSFSQGSWIPLDPHVGASPPQAVDSRDHLASSLNGRVFVTRRTALSRPCRRHYVAGDSQRRAPRIFRSYPIRDSARRRSFSFLNRVWHGRRVSGNRFSGARSPWLSIPPGVLGSVPSSNSLRYPGRSSAVSTRMGTRVAGL